MKRSLALLLACVAVAAPGSAPAQQAPDDAARYPIDPLTVPRPSLTALRVEGPISIDARLDEPEWGRADTTTGTWIQVAPEPGMPATEATVVRILYDDRNLYVGARMYDSDPRNLYVPELTQDFDTQSSDFVAIALDTYHDKQNGFVFGVNPAGAVWDAQTFNDQRDVIPAWEGIIDVAARVAEDSWYVEMAIPFATLRFNPVEGEQTWGMSFFRRIRKNTEDAMWAPVPLQYRVYRFSLAGTLHGLRDLPRSRNLWAKPYVTGDRLTGARASGAANDADAGLDVKWGITPRLTLDLTANTDFSQVEVDAEQVNLTRFSLFFPEKRDFFLENEGTFAFQDVSIRNFRTGSSPRDFRLFHSRRIGLSPAREVLPIAGGARLTGRIGDGLEVGLLEMQTRAASGLPSGIDRPAENFAVARVKGHLGGGSSIGAMLVNRQETGRGPGADYNRSFGIDANLNLFRNLIVSAYAAGTRERTPVGDDERAAMLQAAWRSDIWNVSGLFKHVGDGFNPGVGFVDRTAVKRYFGTVGVHPKLRRGGVLEVNPYVEVDVFTAQHGRLETRTLTPALQLLLMDGGQVTVDVADRTERLFDTTSIAGAEVAPGEYRWREPSLSYRAPGSRALSGLVRVSGGDFYDGRRVSVFGNLLLRPSRHVSLDLGAQHNDLELGGASFTADLFSARLRLARDTRTFLMGFVQYNEATDELITNARFNLIHAPLSDVFVVYTERRSLADGVRDRVLERGVTLKVTKLFAF